MVSAIDHLIPKDFNDNSRVWIYQANRPFTKSEIEKAEKKLKEFVASWTSHGKPVKGFSKILFDQFVVFIADEMASGIGGCSTDSAVRVVKNIEKDFSISMFDRQILAFLIDKKIQLIPLTQVNQCLEEKIITADSLYFNNTILTKKELVSSWIIPAKDSWLAKRIEELKKSII